MARDDDDFIFTISDHEDISDDELLAESTKLSGQGKKRKFTEDAGLNPSKKTKKDKKSKKSKNSKETEGVEDEGAEPEQDLEKNDDIDSDFEFQIGNVDTTFVDEFDGWGDKANDNESKSAEKKSNAVDVDEIIERRRNKNKVPEVKDVADDAEEDEDVEFEGFGDDDELLAEDGFGMGAVSDEEEDDKDDGSDTESDSDGQRDAEKDGDDSDDSDNDSVAAPVPHPMDLEENSASEDESDKEDAAEAKKRADFFAPEEAAVPKKKGSKSTATFQSMSLSRPILKGLASVSFTEPTPIQLKTIPIALQGKDVVGGAVTGSGKTAAFLIPIFERLLYRPKKIPTTRVAIFMPTRELAVQCFNVARKLAAFTDITFAQLVGGFSSREQEAVLKTRPDVVICTPGRFIDHMRNSASFQVENLEILVLDEADRMLEEGFEAELTEILAAIPKSRQTMLFSATMTSSVDKLIRVGMNKPVRLMVDSKKQTVAGLVQEFIRLRLGKEDKRLAYLLYLCAEVYTERVIIFFRQKKEAHRVRVVFGLCGLKASELHGNMSQEQRIQSVESFRSGKSAYLLATDVASRGLDIKNVSTVINYEAPQSHEIYLHRVGRTARAGRTGRACTIAAEPDRKVVKAAVKAARAQGAKVAGRQVPAESLEKWTKKLKDMADDIEAVMEEEKEERALSITERELKKGENLIHHEDEIKARPKRTWFESEKDKLVSKGKGAAELNGPNDGAKKKKPTGKLSGKDRKILEIKDVRTEGKVWKKGKEERGLRHIQGKGKQENGGGKLVKGKGKDVRKGGKVKKR